MTPFRIEQLVKQDRSYFDCGTSVLNDYLQKRAGQEQRKNFSTCYLAICNQSDTVAGFYTLSASSIALVDLPETTKRMLPRYADVPVARLGRLAVDLRFQGRGLGESLLYNAIGRVLRSGIGCYAIVVDAKDEQAISFYRHAGFDVLADTTNVLYLSVAVADALVTSA